jgi:oleandomycin transport system ATP-binding protein
MEYAFRAEGLVRRFGTVTALDGVDLAAAPGSVLGVLGPNGAGKTTAVRILATLLAPDRGRASVCGLDVVRQAPQVRRMIGLTGQYASIDEDLTGAENLVLIGRLLDLRKDRAKARADELLGRFGLDDAAGRRAATYSGGMRRRLDLAASLVGDPAVIFLDEPTTGLDPAKRDDLWRMIRALAGDGVGVLLTTQYLEEADALADAITVIDHGKVIAEGTAGELKRLTGSQTLSVRPAEPSRLADTARIVRSVTGRDPETTGGTLLTAPADGEPMLHDALRLLGDEGIAVVEIALRLPSLDEVFFSLTGRHTGTRDKTTEEVAV